jgi:putative oxidoreductase
MQFLKPYSECIHDTVRIVAGVLFFQHGAQKIFGILGAEESVALGSRLGLAGIIEMTTGALIALGLFTPVAAFIASGEMAVAFFIAHVPRGSIWPLVNGGEPAVLFCFLFLYLASRDSGDWSLDRMLKDRKGA